MLKYISIDRFEGQVAICIGDDETILKIAKKNLPKNCKEGDVLKILKNGTYELDKAKTLKRKEEIYKLQQQLFEEN